MSFPKAEIKLLFLKPEIELLSQEWFIMNAMLMLLIRGMIDN